MKLSILICTLESRKLKLDNLLAQISHQVYESSNSDIEILVETDGKQITTGAKRNKLLNRATGDYIVFIDDDDSIMPEYLSEILKATETNPDCIGMEGWYSINGGNKTLWKLSKDLLDHDEGGVLYRRINHISPVKRDIALQAGFPDKSNAEDKWYSERIVKLIKTEVYIPKQLYHYTYSSVNKEYA